MAEDSNEDQRGLANHLDWLLEPSHYPESTSHVELRETHISWVLLTDEFVYKFKKPVLFDFLDFSKLELREQACKEEVLLNRRLSQDVYLGIVPLALDQEDNVRFGPMFSLTQPQDRAETEFDGNRDVEDSRVIEWAVKMKRLPDHDSLEARIRSKDVSKEDVAAISQTLNNFYQSQSPIQIDGQTYQNRVEQHIRGNLEDLLNCDSWIDSNRIKRIHGAQLKYLLTHKQLLADRIAQGHLIEGHGDLRPDHVYLTKPAVILDCIEFNQEFRQVDVADELSFLAMECERLGAGWIGEQIIDGYAQTVIDSINEDLFSFYFSYRACVRAKVDLLRAKQMSASDRSESLNEVKEYLALAESRLSLFGPPLLIVVRGLSGVGKTTLATELAQELAAEHLSTDVLRQSMATDSNEARYSLESRHRVYDEMLSLANGHVKNGLNVVLDGTFLTSSLHEAVAEIAERNDAKLLFVNCTCDEDLAHQRIASRREEGVSLSEATESVHSQQQQEWEPVAGSLSSITVDTSLPIEELVDAVIACFVSV